MNPFKLEYVTQHTILCDITALNKAYAAFKEGLRQSCDPINNLEALTLDLYYYNDDSDYEEAYELIGLHLDIIPWLVDKLARLHTVYTEVQTAFEVQVGFVEDYCTSEEYARSLSYLLDDSWENCARHQISDFLMGRLFYRFKNHPDLDTDKLLDLLNFEAYTAFDHGLYRITFDGSPGENEILLNDYSTEEYESQLSLSSLTDTITIEEFKEVLPYFSEEFNLKSWEHLKDRYSCFWLPVYVNSTASYILTEQGCSRAIFNALKSYLKES